MKEFAKILGLAIIGTALMLGIAVLAAGVLRSYDREIVSSVILSIVGIAMLLPIAFIDSQKEWVTDICIFLMAWTPMQAIMIAAFL
jgi:hypothetical protein